MKPLQRLRRWARTLGLDAPGVGCAAGRVATVEACEPRLLYAADLNPALWAGVAHTVPVQAFVASVDHQAAATTTVSATLQTPQRPAAREIIFIDAAVPDAEQLLQALLDRRGTGDVVEVVFISSDVDGLRLIGDVLADERDLSAIHIISHGDSGRLQLGNTQVDADTLDRRGADIGRWSQALTTQADILLYGCDVAADSWGTRFVDRLAALTGADVAASTDATGAPSSIQASLLPLQGLQDAQVAKVVLIDSRLTDASGLQDSVSDGAVVLTYDSETESAQAVLARLSAWAVDAGAQIGSLSIVSHGVEGGFQLGKTWIVQESLADVQGAWMSLRGLFTADGELLVLGCDVTASEQGRALMLQLAELTSATVYASDDITGSGGDWLFEFRSDALGTPTNAPLAGVFDVASLLDLDVSLAWYNASWNYRQTLTVSAALLDGAVDASNLTVLVEITQNSLRSVGNGGNVAQTDGGDILFTLSDGTTKLSHEIESYDPVTGRIKAWVNLPTLSAASATTLYAYYGNAAAANQWNASGTWNATFGGVWHLSNNSWTDSTANANNGTNDGSTGTSAIIEEGRAFNGTNQNITVADSASLDETQQITMSAWVRPTVDDNKWRTIMAKGPDGSLNYWFGIKNAELQVYLVNTEYKSGHTLTLNAWSHVVATFENATNTLRMYVNGTQVYSNTAASANPVANASPLYIGRSSLADEWWQGSIDEVRFQQTIESADSIRAHYRTQFSPGTYVALSGEVGAPTITSNGAGATASVNVNEGSTAVTTVAATDPGAPPQTLAYALAGGLDAARFSINTSSGALTFVTAPDFEAPTDSNANNVYLVTVQVSDGTLTDTQALSVSVQDLNDAPVLADTALSITVAEDAGVPSGAVGSLVSAFTGGVTDVDSGAVKGIAITASVETNGIWQYSTNSGASWIAVGAVTNTSALLLADNASTRLYFAPAANFNGSSASALTLRAWDQTSGSAGTKVSTASNGGASAFSSATDVVDVNVTAVNDAPTASNLSAAQTYSEDTALNLIDIVVTDVDSASITATLTLSNAAAGALNTGTSGAVTSTYNAGTGVWSASGAIANVNTLLAALTFTPTANFNSSFTVSTSISDGALSATGSKSFTGTAVNDAPTASNLSAAETYVEDTPLNLIDIVAADVDSANLTATLTLSNAAAGALNTGTSGAVTSTYNAGTGVWSASGAIANVNALLAGLVFTPAADHNSALTLATSVGDGVTAAITGSKAFTGIAVNDAPVANDDSASTAPGVWLDVNVMANDTDADHTLASLVVTVLGSSPGTTATVNGDNSIRFDPGATTDVQTVTYRLSDGSLNSNVATLTVNVAANAPPDSADASATFNEDTPYVFQGSDFVFSDTDGAQTLAGVRIDTLPAEGTLLLNGVAVPALGVVPLAEITAGDLQFVPAADGSGTPYASFTFSVQDSFGGFDAAPNTFTLNVDAGNDAPVASNLGAPEAYTEDTALNLFDIVAADVDSASITATLTLSNAAAGALNTGTAGAVTSTYNAGTGVWTATGALADVNTLLAALTFTPALDFNGAFTVATSVSDGVAAAATGIKSFSGTAVNDAPTASGLNAGQTYTEDVPLALITIVVSDVESNDVTAMLTLSNSAAGSLNTGSSGAVTSSFVAGVWSANGSIADVNVLLAALTFTPASSFDAAFNIATSVNDGVAVAVTGNKVMSALAVNDAPSATNLSADEVYTEDTPLNLITIAVTDIDSANIAATLTLSNSAAGALNAGSSGAVTSTYNAGSGVWSASGALADVNTLLASLVFTPAGDFNSNFSIATSISDGVAAAVTGSKAMTGTAVNDAALLTAASLTLNEGGTVTFSGANFGISDPDDSSFTYAVSGVSGGIFRLSSNAGVAITSFTSADLAGGLVQFVDDDNEVAPAFSVTVNDGDIDSNTLAATINYTAVNDAPALANASTLGYTENQTASAVSPAITVADVDNTTLTSATVQISGNYQGGEDVLAFINDAGMGNVVGVWNSGSGSLTLSSAGATATLAEWQAALRAVTYANSSDNPVTAARTLSFKANDGALDSNTVASSVNVSAVNDEPTLTGLAGDTLSYARGNGAVVIEQGGNAAVLDADSANFSGGTLTVSFVAGSNSAHDALAIRNQGSGTGQIGVSGANVTYQGTTIGSFAGGSSGNNLVITLNANANAANTDALIHNITYENTEVLKPFVGERTVRFVLADGEGGTSVNHDTTVEVGDINSPPVNTVVGAQTTDANGLVLFSSATGARISVSDPDAKNLAIQVTLSAINGAINLAGNQGLSFATGDGTADATMTFTGTITAINAALDGMTFAAAADFTGTASVQISTNDLGNTGAGGPRSDTDTVTITVQQVGRSVWVASSDDVVVPGANGLSSWTAGQVLKFGANDDTLLFEPGTTTGKFSLAGFNLDSGSFGDGNTAIDGLHHVSRNITVGGVALQKGDLLFSSQGNETLGGVAYESGDIIRFRPTTAGDYGAGTFALFFDATDTALKATAFTFVEQAASVGGVTLNTGDMLLSNNGSRDILRFVATQYGDNTAGSSSVFIDGDAGLGFGQDIAALSLVQRNTAIGNQTLAAGTLILALKGEDNSVGSGAPIAVTRFDLFTLNVASTGDTTTSATASLLLQGSEVGLNENPEALMAVTLLSNQGPTLGSQTFSVHENSANGTVVGTVAGSDPEGSKLSYAITAGNTSGAFSINGSSGQITVANSAVLDFETLPAYALTVAAIDSVGAHGTAVVTVDLSNATANVAPRNGVPAAQTTAMNGLVLFSSASGNQVSVSDVDASTQPIQVTLNITNGTLNLMGTQGLTFTTGDGTADATMTFTGAAADINTALNGMSFVAATDFIGMASLQIVSNDLGNSGSGGALTDTDSVSITVREVARSLWVTTENDVASPGAAGVISWTAGQVLQFAADGGTLLFAPGTTTGIFSQAGFNLDSGSFGDRNTVIDVLHHVGRNITVGGVALQKGDLLFSTQGNEALGGVAYESGDIIRFRPTAAGDYGGGTFALFFDATDTTLEATAFTFVEQAVSVGGVTLNAGELLLSNNGSRDILRFVATQYGDTTAGSSSVFIDGDAGLGFGQDITALSLVQRNTGIGNQTLAAGTLILALKGEDNSVGSGAPIAVTRFDLFTLNVASTGDTTTSATASLLLQGSEVGLNENQEALIAATLIQNQGPTVGNQTFSVFENSPATSVVGAVTGSDNEDSTVKYTLTAGNVGGAFAVNASSGEITVANSSALNFETVPVFTLTVAAIDSDGAYGTASVTVNLADVNDAPVLDNNKSPALSAQNEDPGAPMGAVGTLVSELVDFAAPAGQVDNVSDEDSGAQLGIAITAVDTSQGSWWFSINGGTNWTALGAVSETQAKPLAANADTRIYFQPNAAWSGTLASAITFRVWDRSDGLANGSLIDASHHGEKTSISAAVDTASLTVMAVNDAPMATITPASYAATEQLPLNLKNNGLAIADSDAASASVTVTLSVTEGALAVTAGGSGALVSNSGTASVTITGSVAQINALLNTNGTSTVSYLNSSDTPSASATLTLQINDGGNTGSGGALTGSDTAFINITAVNDAPTLSGLAGDALSYAEGDGAVVIEQAGNAAVADADSANLDGGALTVLFSAGGDDAEDVLAVRNQGSGSGQIGVSGSNVTFEGATIGTWTGGSGGAGLVISFNAGAAPAAAQALVRNVTYQNTDTGAPTTGARTVRYLLTDGDGGTSATHDATVTVSAVNDAPVATSASLTLNEGATVTLVPGNFGISDPDDWVFGYTVTGVGGGIFQLASNAGVAITSFTSADLAGGLVQFVDDGNEVAPGFSVKVNDGDVDSNVLAATVNYTPVNDAPVVTAASLTLNEGETVTFAPVNFGVTDPDESVFGYTVSGVSGGIFQLSSNAGVAITAFTSADLASGLVEFVDDGNEVAPAFSVKANDGDVDSNVLAATINYTPVNDAPVVSAASLTLNECEMVALAPGNFGVTDPDDSGFTYTVSGVSGGFFQLSSNAGVAITNFTSTDLTGGLVQFVDDGNEVAPAFSVKVNDGDVDSNVLAATINYTPVNDAPVVTAASLTLNEGETATLAPWNFGIIDPDDAGFTYTVNGVSGGIFQLTSNAGGAITNFTSADLAGGLVQFVDDGNEVAPAFSITVNDGDVDSNTLAATIKYTSVNDAPVATAASLTLNEAETMTLSGANFGVTDPDDGAFIYTVGGVTGGIFQLSNNAGVAIASFTSADLAGGLVQFVDDGNEVAPAFSVRVNDGDVDSNTLAATINYTAVNDAPVVTAVNLTLNEGATVTLSGSDFGVSDPDDTSFTYTVSGLTGGIFQLSNNVGVSITGFSSADLEGGLVLFVDDANEAAPAFSITVNDGDGDGDSNTLVATINYTAVNDAPVVTAASLTLNEGETVTLSGAKFGVTDPDDGAFIYTVGGVTGGIFQLSNDAGVPISSFTSANLAGGLVQFVDDGDEVAPAFSVSVNDGRSDSNLLAATIGYAPVNDAPTVDHLAGGVLAYAEGSGPLQIDQLAAAWVHDDDSGNFDGGKLVISFVSGLDAAEDVLGIATTSHTDGIVALTGDEVLVDGVSVGRAAGGTTGTDLVITFNTQATPAAVSAVLRAVSFENTNPAALAAGLRTLQVQLSDGDGGTAQTQPVQVWVSAVDDAPVGQAVTLGTLAEGQSLRAETAAIADADGLGAFSYQWLRNGSAIGGATGVEYQLAADDIGAEVTVRVSWVDGLGKSENLTSGGAGRVAKALQAPPSLAYGGGAAAAPAETTSTPAATAPKTLETPGTSVAAAAPNDGDPEKPTFEPAAPVPITVSEIETGPDSALTVLPSFLNGAADLPSWLRRDDAETPQLRALTFEWIPMEAETTKDENSDSAVRESLRVQARAGMAPGSDVSDDGSSGNAASTSGDDESNLIRILHDAKPLASASFTAGVLWWLTRSGGLLTSILMGVPAWRHVDLLPVISGDGTKPAKGSDADDDGSDFDDSAVADLFDDPASALAAEGTH